MEIDRVIEIHPDAKYVVVVSDNATGNQLATWRRQLQEWWSDSGSPFMIAKDVKLVRVDEID